MKIRFSTFYIANKRFWTTKTSVSKPHKIRFFFKGLVHGFGQKFEIFVNTSFYAKYPEKKYLATFSLENKPFYIIETWILKNAKMAFFQRGESMIFVKKLTVFNLLCLSKIEGEEAFPDVLDRKELSENYKNICL